MSLTEELVKARAAFDTIAEAIYSGMEFRYTLASTPEALAAAQTLAKYVKHLTEADTTAECPNCYGTGQVLTFDLSPIGMSVPCPACELNR